VDRLRRCPCLYQRAELQASEWVNVTLADVTDIAKDLKVFEHCVPAFAPRFDVINVELHVFAWHRAAEPATRSIAHKDQCT